MFEIYSEVRATLSANAINAIDGNILDIVRQYVLTATVEQVIADNSIQYQLYGTLDGILIAKTKLEELLNSLHVKKLAKEATDLDSTTLSEENSSLADEGNTSYDKDKTSCLSDDKERETNASSNGYMSAATESCSIRSKPLSKKLRLFHKDRPRTSQRTRSARLAQQLRTLKKSTLRSKPRYNDPEWLSENLQQMKLATEDSDPDSTGTDVKVKTPARKPCKARNYETISIVKYSCDFCSFRTKRSSHFVKHMAVHDKVVLSCPHCSYQTTTKRYYDRHQRLHCKRTFVHQCEECPYKTHRKEHYLRHMNTVHNSERPHLCHICGKTFKRGDALHQHHLVHSGDVLENSSHKCSVCDKHFRSQSHLNEHQAVHSRLRNFLCEVCGAAFKTRSVHRKHVQTMHRNPKAFSCDICSRKFNAPYTLKRHKKTHISKAKHLPLGMSESNDLSACENQSDVPGIPCNSPQSASESEGVPNLPVQPVVSVTAPVNVLSGFPLGMNVLGGSILQQVTPPVVPNPEPPTFIFLDNVAPQL